MAQPWALLSMWLNANKGRRWAGDKPLSLHLSASCKHWRQQSSAAPHLPRIQPIRGAAMDKNKFLRKAEPTANVCRWTWGSLPSLWQQHLQPCAAVWGPVCISCFLNLELSLFFILSAAGKYPVCYVALIQQSEMCSGVILRIPGVMRWGEDTVPHWYYILILLRMISTFLLHLSVQWTDTKQQLKK